MEEENWHLLTTALLTRGRGKNQGFIFVREFNKSFLHSFKLEVFATKPRNPIVTKNNTHNYKIFQSGWRFFYYLRSLNSGFLPARCPKDWRRKNIIREKPWTHRCRKICPITPPWDRSASSQSVPLLQSDLFTLALPRLTRRAAVLLHHTYNAPNSGLKLNINNPFP